MHTSDAMARAESARGESDRRTSDGNAADRGSPDRGARAHVASAHVVSAHVVSGHDAPERVAAAQDAQADDDGARDGRARDGAARTSGAWRTPRAALALAALIALVGALLTYANRGLPLVRNSLVYARASEHVIEHGYDPRSVVADSKLSYDKPILYAWVSAPLVRALGNHDGLRASSWLTSAAYLLALLHFARSFRALLPERAVARFVWLAALGPCVLYQFWSAHPDGWFAALAVLAWSETRRLVVEPSASPVRGVAALGATLLVAILLKNYGLVLLASCPLYLACHLRELRADRARWKRLWIALACMLALLGAWVVAAWTGHNPLSRLEGEGGGVGQYGVGALATNARGTLVALGIALALQFHVALALAWRSRAWNRELLLALACFGGPYVVGLLPFPTTFYNMRYFVPLFALGALVLARAASASARPANAAFENDGSENDAERAGTSDRRSPRTRALLAVHALVASALVLVFNVAPLYRACERWIPSLEVNWIGVPLSLLDNLRMPLHLEQQAVLDEIERNVPAASVLYMVDARYYGDAQHGVYERAGRIRADIETRYVDARAWRPLEREFFVYCARPLDLARFGDVQDFGRGLARVRAH